MLSRNHYSRAYSCSDNVNMTRREAPYEHTYPLSYEYIKSILREHLLDGKTYKNLNPTEAQDELRAFYTKQDAVRI